MNAVAFYPFLLRLPPALSTLAVAALVVLTFAPFHVLHPLRVVRLRWLTLWLLGSWAVLAIYTVALVISMSARLLSQVFAPLPSISSAAILRIRTDQNVQGVIEDMTEPSRVREACMALLTLTALEIVLGIDNVIFLSIIVSDPAAASNTGTADRAVAGAENSASFCSASWSG